MSTTEGEEWVTGDATPGPSKERPAQQWVCSDNPCFICELFCYKLRTSWAYTGHPGCVCTTRDVTAEFRYVSTDADTYTQDEFVEAGTVPGNSGSTYGHQGQTYGVQNGSQSSRKAYYKYRTTYTTYRDTFRCYRMAEEEQEIYEYRKKKSVEMIGVQIGRD